MKERRRRSPRAARGQKAVSLVASRRRNLPHAASRGIRMASIFLEAMSTEPARVKSIVEVLLPLNIRYKVVCV